MSLASYQLLHSAMLFLKWVQRYDYFLNYANFYISFFLLSTFSRKKLGHIK